MATLSYFLIYAIAELNPFYYHLASLLLHTLNAILVYWLANLILKNQLGALIAALLFACHPALSEAVNCIDFNDDLLAAFFFLLSLIFYIRLKTEECNIEYRGVFFGIIFLFFGGIVQGNGHHAAGHYFSLRLRAAGWRAGPPNDQTCVKYPAEKSLFLFRICCRQPGVYGYSVFHFI